MDEIFILIDGYPNYAVSNLGRVKSLNYHRTGKEKVLNCGVDRNGYLRVVLYKNRKPKTFYIQKLVAMAFIQNPNNLHEVDHINGIRDDNRSENLRWVTHKENMNNELTKQKLSFVMKGKNKGKKLSDEHKTKISQSKKGNKSTKGKHWKLDPLTSKRVYS